MGQGTELGAALVEHLTRIGAIRFRTGVLQPAARLLDLYGEDIRARTFTTYGFQRGEMVLRPDFTVPVAVDYLASKTGEARYCYEGCVFRAAEGLDHHQPEENQVGYEILGSQNPLTTEIEVFEVFWRVLAEFPIVGVLGDISILRRAVGELKTHEARKKTLLRHIWRPERFRALLQQFGTQKSSEPPKPFDLETSPELKIGVRTEQEVIERLQTLAEDAAITPISAEEIARIEGLLDMCCPAEDVEDNLKNLGLEAPDFVPRLEAFSRAGLDLKRLSFEGSLGCTSMEYYDGFVFGFFHKDFQKLGPIVSGGRYDAMMRFLGMRYCAAVGAVLRSDFLDRLLEKSNA